MKTFLPVFVILISLIASACAPQAGAASSAAVTANPPAGGQLVPEVSTTLPDNTVPPITETTSPASSGQTSSPESITLQDNGRTFTYHVGDSFLLNLGDGVYDWTVSVDNPKVISLKIGVMVIKGAQGIYEALAPGTTALNASGDPKCRKSIPACGMRSILFEVTVVVE